SVHLIKVLDVLFLQFVYDVFRGSHRKRKNRPGRILIRLRYTRSAIDYKQVLAIVSLAVFIEDGPLRIVPHTSRSNLVNDPAGRLQTVVVFLTSFSPRNDAAHLVNDLLKGFLHVFRLLDFVVAPLVMESQYRDTIFIDRVRVDLAIVILAGNRFAATCHTEGCAVEPPVVILQRDPVSAGAFHFSVTSRVLSIQALH